MIIESAKPKEKIFYPDIQDNLELPESDRFGIVLTVPTTARMVKAFDNVIDGEDIKQEMNYDKYIKLHVKKMINPPKLKIGKITRNMNINDVFELEVLTTIWQQLSDNIKQIREVDIKK